MAITGFIGRSRLPWSLRNSEEGTLRQLNPITLGSGGQVGDICVVFVSGVGNKAVFTGSGLTPSGWSPIVAAGLNGDLGDTRSQWSAAWKILDAGDDQTYTFMGANGSYTSHVLRFTGPSAVAQVHTDAQSTTGNPTAQVKAIGAETERLVVLGFSSDQFSTFSPAADDTIGTGPETSYKIYNSSPAETTIDMPDAGARNMLASCVLKAAD